MNYTEYKRTGLRALRTAAVYYCIDVFVLQKCTLLYTVVIFFGKDARQSQIYEKIESGFNGLDKNKDILIRVLY